MTLTVGSLFSGIGGFDLGLERAGMKVIWQSEIDEFASKVLKKHWPDVPNLGDITKVDWTNIERPDVICGGYPCQPFSTAGKRGGASDPRHLWPAMFNAICLLRPQYALRKMYEDICLWGSVEFLATWPKSGTTQNGKSFPQPPLVRHTKETGYSLWPTPRANSAMAATITPESAWNPNRFPNLETMVGRSLWPTPTTQEIEHPNAELTTKNRRKSKNGKSSHSLNLADAVQKWPTPRASKAMADSPQAIQNNLKKKGYKSKLEQAVQLWPTPTASSWGSTGHRAMLQTKVNNGTISENDKKQMTSGNGGKLNPTWVEWLMGFPTGWTDLKD